MTRQDRRPSWILPLSKRYKVSKKYKDTVKQIKECQLINNWRCVRRLKYLLRHAWWGIKRYKD